MAGSIVCLICNQSSGLLCKKCARNPYSVEKVRQKLAQRKDFKTLSNFYKKNLSQIKDKNSKKFWDKKLPHDGQLEKQDGMTKDRAVITASFIPSGEKKILDIGAGYGFVEEILYNKKFKGQLYGVDISEKGIKFLQKRFPNGKFKVGSLYDLQYPQKYFDVVLALEVLEHIPPHKLFPVLKKIKRILKPKGVFIISVPLNEGLEFMKDNPSGHVRMYTQELIQAELHFGGFRVKKYKELSAFSRFYSIKKTMKQVFLKNKWQANNIILQAISV